jgi:GNAT superfamily N-acetyltransferase
MERSVRITRAEKKDLRAILELQYLAYRQHAVIYSDTYIRALMQTLDDIETEFENCIFLKAVNGDGDIIGSVRAYAENGTLFIGRLMVHPELQGKGIGTELLSSIEHACPQERCELFTGMKSYDNIRFYERSGYNKFKEENVRPGMTLVYMQK